LLYIILKLLFGRIADHSMTIRGKLLIIVNGYVKYLLTSHIADHNMIKKAKDFAEEV